MPILPVALPLLVAAALIGLGPLLRRPNAADLVAVAAAAAATACSAVLLVRAADGLDVYWVGGWAPRPGGIVLGVDLAVDRAGAALATLAGLLTTGALVFSRRYFEAVGTLFHALMLVFLAALSGFVLSGDLFNMFVFFELMSVSAYALTGYQIEERSAIQGALNFAVTNSLGAILVLFGIALLYGRTGALNLAQIGQALTATGPADRLVVVAFALLVAGFFVKAAIVPFHFWLADAYAVAPTPVCVLFAGVMSELGLYAVARLYWTVFAPAVNGHAQALRGILLTVGALTALLGAVMCLPQRHLARLLAFATISHIGVMLLGVALLGAGEATGFAGVLLYLLADGLVKASLFIAVGMLAYRFGTFDLDQLTGAGEHMPRTAALTLVGGAALAGLPPFGTWLGKALLDEAAAAAGHGWVALVVLISSVLTGGAVFHFAVRVFLSASPGTAPVGGALPVRRPRPPLMMFLPGIAFLAVALALGAVPGAAAWAAVAAHTFTDTAGYTTTVLLGAEPGPVPNLPGLSHPTEAVLIGLATTCLAAFVGLSGLRRPSRQAAADTGPGTGPNGGRATRSTRTPPRQSPRLLPRLLDGPMTALRAIHSGEVGDSVAWLTVGAATFTALFSLLLS